MSWTANFVSIVFRPAPRPGRWSGCFSGYYRRHDNALLGLSCAAKERSALPDAGTWRNNHVYEGISDAPRASGTWGVNWLPAFRSLSDEVTTGLTAARSN